MSAAAPVVSAKPIRFHRCGPAGIVFHPPCFVPFTERVEYCPRFPA